MPQCCFTYNSAGAPLCGNSEYSGGGGYDETCKFYATDSDGQYIVDGDGNQVCLCNGQYQLDENEYYVMDENNQPLVCFIC